MPKIQQGSGESMSTATSRLKRIPQHQEYGTAGSRYGGTRLYNDDNSSPKPEAFTTETNSKVEEAASSINTPNSSNKDTLWNTSIFPTKVAMSPPVEKDRVIPQIYIQSIAAIVGIVSGILVSVFKLSIDAIRQFFYEGSILNKIIPASIGGGSLPIFVIPIIGSIGVVLLSLTGEFAPGLRGVVKEVDEQSLNAQFSDALDTINGDTTENNNNNFQKLIWIIKENALKPIRKSLAAILTLGTGNSLGPEGPGVEIGAAVSRLGMMLWPPDLMKRLNSNDQEISREDDNGRIARNRLLLACGAAAGVSAGFNAPLSGVFFALEVVQASLQPVNIPSPLPAEEGTRGISSSKSTVATNSNIELQQQSLSSIQGSITAILISSVFAALVARILLGNELALTLVTYEILTPLIELPLYILLGISCGLVSVVFSQSAKFFKKLFNGAVGPKFVQNAFGSIPKPALPIIGGLTCGVVGVFYPQILFFGYDTLNNLLEDNTIPTTLLLTLLAVKTFTTAVCAGSGLVGGMYLFEVFASHYRCFFFCIIYLTTPYHCFISGTLAPSLFLGGMTGASFHNIASVSLTAFNIPEVIKLASGSDLIFGLAGVPAYSMVGAASTLAAIFRAPLTASLLLFEITRNYDVLLPLLASAGVASLVSDIVESKVEQAKSQQ